tara:strand:- start:937 stop:1371 length:435 start_codon:yes stop_codon:yes gene_type:complete
MTLIVRNPNAGFVPHSYFGSLFEDLFQLDPFANRSFNTRDDQVHTQSLEDRHEISIAAPGLKKTDFNIQLKGGKLTISYGACEANQESASIRRTFSKSAFSKIYSVSRDTVPEDIKAKYSAGILKVTVKRPENEVPTEHSIKIN